MPCAEDESDASMRARLVESLSSSFPGSALSKALQAVNDDELDKDPLSHSCFAELRLEKGRMEVDEDEDDEELTSLAWLQDTDLLKNIGGAAGGEHGLCASPSSDDDTQKENALCGGGGPRAGIFGQTHPPHIPYNPQKHINSKPPYSFSCLIFMAIEDSPIKKLPVKDIYNWILTHFPYFRYAPTGWKNSVRHNLSLNKCFKKVEKEKGHGLGKGSLWCIDPIFRPNLLQALRKTPYHPYHQLQMLSTPQPPNGLYTIHGVLPPGSRSLPLAPKLSINSPSPHLFPFLSKRLSQSGAHDSLSLGDSDIDVANTLVSLKRAAESRRPLKCHNGSRSRSPSPPEFGSAREKQLLREKLRSRTSIPKLPEICTAPPSEDHAYCITEEQVKAARAAISPGSSSSIDEEYEFGAEDDDDDFEEDLDDDLEEAVVKTTPGKKANTRGGTGRWSKASRRKSNKRYSSGGGKNKKLDRSHSDISCTDSSDRLSDLDDTGGSDGEQKSRVRGLIVKIEKRKRKRKNSAPVPLYKKRLVTDTDDEEDEAMDDDDEERKIVAGADALLNLASAAMALSALSPSSNNNNNNSSNHNNNNDTKFSQVAVKEEPTSDQE